MTKNHILRVGAVKVDITPEFGTQLGGDIGRHRPATEIRDRLYARVIVLASEANVLCAVACDLDCVNRDIGLTLRSQIAEIIGGGPEDAMLHCSQSHSAPRVGGFLEDFRKNVPPEMAWARGDTPAYNAFFAERLIAGAKKAMGNLVPARVKFARAIDNRCAFNRRFILRDGTGKTHPSKCSEAILYCEGPIDPEASLLLFEDDDAKPIAGLLHHTCHPTHGYPKRYASADWPGLWSEIVREKLGGNAVIGCFNGACGNIAPSNHANPDYDAATSLDLMLKHLAETGDTLIKNLAPVAGLPLKRANATLKIPWRRPTEETIAGAEKLLAEHPSPNFLDEKKTRIPWEWILAVRDLDKARIIQRCPDYPFEIQAFRIGDGALVGWPGEPFVEAQLELKLKAKARYLILGHESNGGDCGYLPTQKAVQAGGYEVEIGAKLVPGALETITAKTIALLNGLFPSEEI